MQIGTMMRLSLPLLTALFLSFTSEAFSAPASSTTFAATTTTSTTPRFHQHPYSLATKPHQQQQRRREHDVAPLRPLFSSSDEAIEVEVGDESLATTPEPEESPVSTTTTTTTAATKTTSISSATFSLCKAILGTGVLALPSGVAAVSDFPKMLWPANLLLLAMGSLSAYTFSMYGRLAYQLKAKSLGEIWSKAYDTKINSLNAAPKKSPISMVNFVYCFGVCLTFLLVIGDALKSLMDLAAGGAATAWWASRQTAILSVVATCLWPLCNLKSLASLAPISLIGVMGTIATTGFIMWRCPALVKSSPYADPTFLKNSVPILPKFGTYSKLLSPAPLILLAMGCVALMAHFSAPEFLNSFQPSSTTTTDSTTVTGTEEMAAAMSESLPANMTAAMESVPEPLVVTETTRKVKELTPLQKYNRMTIMGFAAAMLLNTLTLTAGFLTFGGSSMGIVLNNYAATDLGAAMSRLLTTISVIGGFPFLFGPTRSSLVELFQIPKKSERKVSALLLGTMTGISMLIKDAGFVVSFNGALMGSAIVYIFPALINLRVTRLQSENRRLERNFCRFLVGFGTLSAVIGGTTSVLNSYFPHLLR